METTTRGISTKLREKFADGFMPIARDLRRQGFTDWEISNAFTKYVETKQRQTYEKYELFLNPAEIFHRLADEYLAKADSKIESIYYDLLQKWNINFKFQYQISKYRADFLIDGWLVFEIDGPDHDKGKDLIRDEHMQDLGYTVFRVPAWLASADPLAVMERLWEIVKPELTVDYETRIKNRMAVLSAQAISLGTNVPDLKDRLKNRLAKLKEQAKKLENK